MSSPLFPTSSAECNELLRQFLEESARLEEQHYACLEGAPRDDANAGGTCSKASCQWVHDTRGKVSRKGSEETSICLKRLEAHREREREAARARAEAAREEARADAERTSRREAERQRDDSDRRVREAQRQRDDQERKNRDEAQAQRERERQGEESRDRQIREAQLRDAERDRGRIDAEVQQRLAEARAREAEAKRERDAKEQSVYLDLITKLKEAKDTPSTAIEVIRNPFGKTLELAGDHLAGTLADKALDTYAPIGPEGRDARYEATAAVVDEVRSRALGGNPFAEKISGVAMEGVHKINRQVIGKMDELGRQMEAVSTPTGPTQSLRSNPFSGGSSTAAPPADNARGTQVAVPARAAATPADNPFAAAPQRYRDETAGRDYEIPAGHTLYRSIDSEELTVVAESRVAAANSDDRWVNGQLRCNANGKGRILGECERRRRAANPFATR